MSKLPKAPLIEVIVEFKWELRSERSVTLMQYLYGDLYNENKSLYPYRETLQAHGLIPQSLPVQRFRSSENSYPLIQIAPGYLSIHHTDEQYDWKDFSVKAKDLGSQLLSLYKFGVNDKIFPSFIYLDFFAFNFKKQNVLDFINTNFNLSLNQNFLDESSSPGDILLRMTYPIKNDLLYIEFSKGYYSGTEGILLQTKLSSSTLEPQEADMHDWLDSSHSFCSDLFKKIIHPDLYESFKN